jgi:organic hydroperoxide reductase OsmC/OhrA
VAPKSFEYAAALDRTGRILAENDAPVELEEVWLPEHLVLAAIARCTVAALRFHARTSTVAASARAKGVVTRRGEDRKYAFVEIDVALDVDMAPPPTEGLGELLAKAERDCFVGNSLTVGPRYAWRVNGEAALPSPAP